MNNLFCSWIFVLTVIIVALSPSAQAMGLVFQNVPYFLRAEDAKIHVIVRKIFCGSPTTVVCVDAM